MSPSSQRHPTLRMYGSLAVPKPIPGDWTSWASNPPTRNASISSAASAIEPDTSYRASYNSTSRSTSANWEDATDAQAQKGLLPMDTNALHHTRALDRQATFTASRTVASSSTKRFDFDIDNSVQEDRSVGPKNGQYSPQRYDSEAAKDQVPRFPSVSSPTRPVFPVPGYSGPTNSITGSILGQYNTFNVPSGASENLPLPSRDMSTEDEYQNHQSLPVQQTTPVPPLRPYGYPPPPDYNSYHGHDFSFGYARPDNVFGSLGISSTPPTLYLNPGMPVPQLNPSGVPIPDMYRQQMYYYDNSQLPPQYYLPISQSVVYSQPLPNHSPMVAPQQPSTLLDKKPESQYNVHQTATNHLYGSVRSLPLQQPYPEYSQVFPAHSPMQHPHTFLQKNMRASRRWPHNNDSTVALRSSLLEEFRANKSRKWELRDIYGYVVEFSGDQHGSRFIQQKLGTATSEEKQTIFDEIVPANAAALMIDVFGNYVIQKLFEHGTQLQKMRLAQEMEGHIYSLSCQMYGCRVVQKAIECVLPDQQALFVKELEPHVLKCVKDPNGNHVIQKLVERVPPEILGFIQIFPGSVYELATHSYGCRVLQRCFEHLSDEYARPLMDELLKYTTNLMQDQFGNYVIQYVLEKGKVHDRAFVISKLRGQILTLARHKFASNVVEKALVSADADTRRRLIDEILVLRPDGVTPITGMMKDQYANYVLQRAMSVAVGEQKEALFNKVTPQVQIERVIEKHAPTLKT